MPKASRVGETSTNTSAATLTLGGAISGFRTVASKHSVGETGIELVISDAAGNWEEGVFTFTSAGPTVMTRTAILSSSNADAPVIFLAGSKTVQETASATFLNQLSGVRSIAFTPSIPFTFQGETYMGQYNMSGPYAFTIAGGAVKGAYIIGQIVGDGTNTPTFDASIKDSGGGTTYDVRSGYPNKIYFWYDGFDYQRQYGQVANATPVPTPATALLMSGPTGGVVSVASTSFSVTANGTITGTVTWTPAESGTGTAGTFTPTSGTTPGSFTYTPGSTGAKTISITNNGGLTNPTPITYTVTAAATVPNTMTAPVATAGDTTASIAFTPPSNGGSAITSYTITPYIGATAQTAQNTTTLTSPYVATSLINGTAYTFKIHANNLVGPGIDSPASNSVTPAVAAPTFIRFGPPLMSTTESGTGPYAYTGTGGSFADPIGGIATKHLASGVDGSLEVTMDNLGDPGGGAMFAINSTTTVSGYMSLVVYAWYFSGSYNVKTGGSEPNNPPAAVTDRTRWRRAGSVLYFEISKDGGSTWIIRVSYTGMPTGVLYFQILPAGTSKMSNPIGIGLV